MMYSLLGTQSSGAIESNLQPSESVKSISAMQVAKAIAADTAVGLAKFIKPPGVVNYFTKVYEIPVPSGYSLKKFTDEFNKAMGTSFYIAKIRQDNPGLEEKLDEASTLKNGTLLCVMVYCIVK